MSNIDAYKNDLENLLKGGELLFQELTLSQVKTEKKKEDRKKIIEEVGGTFEEKYQSWYTESLAVIRQLLPERLLEFEFLYRGDGKRKEIDETNFSIQDWLMGRRADVDVFFDKKRFDDSHAVEMRFRNQLDILNSVTRRFESKLFEIKQLVQADLFDSEIDAAKELLKNGYGRAAGVVSGVVLESHLAQVCANHSITISKKNPTINDYNELLKNGSVIDVPQWRFIQRLGDLRNLCGHKKTDEPTKENVQELVDGVEKITKTLY
jgi:hypothetical protein